LFTTRTKCGKHGDVTCLCGLVKVYAERCDVTAVVAGRMFDKEVASV